jgi:hypothetical protein
MEMYASGYVYANNYLQAGNSLRAPIFYDSNDTGYYTDPRSTSILWDLTISGANHKYLTINPGNGWEAMVRYIGGSGASWYVGKRTSTQLLGSTDAFHFYSETSARTVGGYDTAGNHWADGSSRSPIFYDSNDTQYKFDGTGESVFGYGRFNAATSGWSLMVGTNDSSRVYNDNSR